MASASPHRPSLRFRGRSFMALVLQPEIPFEAWFAELDLLTQRSPAFFVGRPVILDLTNLPIDKPGLRTVISELSERGVRIMGIEGAPPDLLGLGDPPPLVGGRPVGLEQPTSAPARDPAPSREPTPVAKPVAEPPPPPSPAPESRVASLLLENPVRSGQSIIFPEGDVTVLGHVASGAEIVAGGSIHVYGALRGRALAGAMGNPRARIYCRKLEAELLAIDGLYKTAEDMQSDLHGRSVQAWLNGEAIMIAGLD